MWNYDYLLNKPSRGKDPTKDATPYKDMAGAGIQGRKVYLHSRFDLPKHYDASFLKRSGQNVTVRPLRAGRFTFDVYFEDLTDQELANLEFAIGGTKGRLQKLGHGRPLGMGSVLVKVERCETRAYSYDGTKNDISAQTVVLPNDWMGRNLPQDDLSQARRRLVTFIARDLSQIPYGNGETLGDRVSYPAAFDEPLSDTNTTFDWFRANRGSVRAPSIINTLQTLSVEEIRDEQIWQGLPD
jgi:hypothetical protein